MDAVTRAIQGRSRRVNKNTEMTMTVEQMLSESKSYQMQAEEYLEHIKCLEAKIERLNGVIEGLKFAVRCNGVSGGEVL